MSRTLGQKRAEYCLSQLRQMRFDSESDSEKFKNFSAGLPALIIQNGFGQTLAFLVAKGEDKHIAAYNIIVGWLVRQDILTSDDQPAGLLGQISRLEQTQYLSAQKETLAMLEWLKRYANAELFR